MLPNPDELAAAVRRERAYGWTLGFGLLGAAWIALGEPRSGGALMALLGCGLLGWLASHQRNAATRLGWLAVGGATLSIPGAYLLARGPAFAALAAGGGALAMLLGWTLQGRLARLGSHLEDADVAQAYASKWLLGASAGTALLGLAIGATPLGVASILVAVLAAARWAIARDRVTSRRRWLREIRAGASPYWTLQPRAPFEPQASGLPALCAMTPLDGVLLPRGDSGPYRGQPHALVPLTSGRPSRPGWSSLGALRPGTAWLLAIAGPFIASGAVWSKAYVFWNPHLGGYIAAVVLSAVPAILIGFGAAWLHRPQKGYLTLFVCFSLLLGQLFWSAVYLPWIE